MSAHDHEWVPMRERHGVLDSVPFMCMFVECLALTHPRSCVDDEGKIECVCGLDEIEQRRAEMAEP